MERNELQVFENETFGEIRMVLIDNEPWFVAADVCKILEHSNPTVAMASLEPYEKTKLNLGLTGGNTNVISESGFYTLVLRSKKLIAKPFRLWVTTEVLPAIRKTGKYEMTTETNVSIVGTDFNTFRDAIEKQLEGQTVQINAMEDLLGEQAEMLGKVVENMTLSTRQQQKLYKAAKDRINKLLDGAHSSRYKCYSKSYFINMWNELKEKFGCSSYKDLNPLYYNEAFDFIAEWVYTER
ncbi:MULTISPECIES: BRO family protein [Blautia]|jgi:prophage antirepressor-like protein|uniref:ORF6C domain-containing protein n=1 Tax=Blautia fusiformis TaxID=2881264 RepID=A0AAW4W7B5_9FIRM|nr:MULTISPECIES: BRO family protein [Blautia]MCC2228445.1 ORF6C domain-containing protein [Blautia fusiformis]